MPAYMSVFIECQKRCIFCDAKKWAVFLSFICLLYYQVKMERETDPAKLFEIIEQMGEG